MPTFIELKTAVRLKDDGSEATYIVSIGEPVASVAIAAAAMASAIRIEIEAFEKHAKEALEHLFNVGECSTSREMRSRPALGPHG